MVLDTRDTLARKLLGHAGFSIRRLKIRGTANTPHNLIHRLSSKETHFVQSGARLYGHSEALPTLAATIIESH